MSRKCPRTRFDGWVEVASGGQRLRGAGHDLSRDGIGLSLEETPPAVTSQLVSEFALPGIGLPLELQGQVVWMNPETRSLGVRFQGVDPGLADLIANFVAGRL